MFRKTNIILDISGWSDIISSDKRTKGGETMFDYSKLKGKIKEVCGTQDNFAKRLSIGRVSLSKRLNGFTDFSQEEIKKSCDILNITYDEIPTYFFSLAVQ